MTHEFAIDGSISAEVLAELGDGEIAYVRAITSDEITELFPQAVPDLVPGLQLWALLNADGTPILLTDSREAAEINAKENNLHAMSVH